MSASEIKSAFVRKDSYRKMQQSDELMGSVENSKSYAPQSQTSLVTRSSSHRREGEGGSWWQRTRDYLRQLYYNTREREVSPRLLASLCCILFLLLLLLILIGIILNALFKTYSVTEFLLYPPICDECRRKNGGVAPAQMPSSVFVHFYSPNQAHFELRGNQPFKSNSFTAIDFQTGYIAIADHALTDSNGRHTTCFIMPLDRSAISSIDALREAVSDSDYEIQAHFGWQEFWQFDAEPIEPVAANSKFTDRIEDCVNAKWYFLKQAVHSRDASCSDCYDFCLPDWAVVRKEKYEDQSTIG
ncbi:BRICHOS domain protein, partial [Oesophagostomum dentatum]